MALSADGAVLYAADLLANTVAVFDRQSGKLLRRLSTTAMPYRLLLDAERRELLVTSWSQGEVVRHDLDPGSVVQRIPVGAHTTDMIWQPASADGKRPQRLIVAASHTHEVSLLTREAGGTLAVHERINVAMMPKQPVGMTPAARR